MSNPAPLYALRCFGPGEYQMAKFDADFNVAAVYNLRAKGHSYLCDCPASARAVKTKPCKHQRMMPFMLGAVNSDRFYEPEAGRWIEVLPKELTAEGYNGAPPLPADSAPTAQQATPPVAPTPTAQPPAAAIRRRI